MKGAVLTIGGQILTDMRISLITNDVVVNRPILNDKI